MSEKLSRDVARSPSNQSILGGNEQRSYYLAVGKDVDPADPNNGIEIYREFDHSAFNCGKKAAIHLRSHLTQKTGTEYFMAEQVDMNTFPYILVKLTDNWVHIVTLFRFVNLTQTRIVTFLFSNFEEFCNGWNRANKDYKIFPIP